MTAPPAVELGLGYRLTPTGALGRGAGIVGYVLHHPRPDTAADCRALLLTDPTYLPDRPHWTVTSTAQPPSGLHPSPRLLTLIPSIDCRTCGAHGWVRDGRWVPAG